MFRFTLDIGNTRTKACVFDANDQLVAEEICEHVTVDLLKRWHGQWKFSGSILSTVAEQPESVVEWLKANTFFVQLDAQTPLPFKNLYGTPETLGKDRLAGIAGAFALFPHQACLVIDAGTCIKYDFITQDGEYLGGSILAGIDMRFKALQHYTARLPLISPQPFDEETFLGDSTETAIRTGVMWGVRHEAEGFIAQYRQRFGEICVLITGGDADYLKTSLKSRIFALPNLVATGLNQILKHQNALIQ